MSVLASVLQPLALVLPQKVFVHSYAYQTLYILCL